MSLDRSYSLIKKELYAGFKTDQFLEIEDSLVLLELFDI